MTKIFFVFPRCLVWEKRLVVVTGAITSVVRGPLGGALLLLYQYYQGSQLLGILELLL